MADREGPTLYSIAAHRGFADALVAGLVPRYSTPDFGLAKVTLLVPSSRSARIISEAFVRYAGEQGLDGLLMPRMAMIGDLDLAENLGTLLDPIAGHAIAPAVEPTRRWLELAKLIAVAHQANGREAPGAAGLLRMARELAATLDRLTAEEVTPEHMLSDSVMDRFPDIAKHWQDNLWLFATVQRMWFSALEERGEIELVERRNRLFAAASNAWKRNPPTDPILAVGVTSAAPALARLLRTIADCPNGAVILPDLDLKISAEAWDELGRAGQPDEESDEVFGRNDAVTHPQYHLKLLLNRMGVNRAEVEPWHRRGMSAASPARSRAISSLFLPPKASKNWAELEARERRLSGVRTLECATIEEEAQTIALAIRQALEEAEKRVALVTPDRTLARRVVGHLKRWNVDADDTAGQPLHLTPAARFILQLADILGEGAGPVPLIAALSHPLVKQGEGRQDWLAALRAFEYHLRGPRPAPGLGALAAIAREAGVAEWWDSVAPLIGKLLSLNESEELDLFQSLEEVLAIADSLAGDSLWSNPDGRALSKFVEDMRAHASALPTALKPADLPVILREAMTQISVRPPYGGHPRVAIYGLLESRMSRADLVICAGLNEGVWPRIPSPDPLLAPAITRALGVPGADFRIGLAAHDLAGAMGAPEVILTRAERDADGPTIPSRFLLRVQALLGELAEGHRESELADWAQALDRRSERAEPYSRPEPKPSSKLRALPIKVTALDRLLGDPFQFYAQEILQLKDLDDLDAEVGPAWQGIVAHTILERWHEAMQIDSSASISAIADAVLEEENTHPVLRGLWRPRLVSALEWIAEKVRADSPKREVVAWEAKGEMVVDGVRIYGRADRIDRLEDGSIAIVDYKTGKPPSGTQVEAGFALQLGLLGLIAEDDGYKDLSLGSAVASSFEYWSLGRDTKSDGFGYVGIPMKITDRQKGLLPEEFLPHHEAKLAEAIGGYIKGNKPFTARLNPDYPAYNSYDQLMRLDEWERQFGADENEGEGAE